jgi:predicted CxxxxCH...CXXCH cytochrome family protein
MLKNGVYLLLFACCLLLPVLANATWYVTASKSGGDATCRVVPAGSTAIPGSSGFKNISTIAGSGFQVNRVTLDGAVLCITPPSGSLPLCATSTFYTVPYAAGKTYRTLVGYFGPATMLSITVNPDAHTSYRVISPVNGLLTNIAKGESRTIAIIPYAGYAVGAVSAPGCTQAPSMQFADGKDVTCANIQNSITIDVGPSPISQVVTASAGPDRTANGTGPAQAITLNGSATYTIGPVTYAWSAIGANAAGAHFGSPTAASTTFYGDAPGTYEVQLIATAAGPTVSAPDTALVTVRNPTDYQESLCSSCHSSRNAAVVADYDSSRHKTATGQIVVCQTCHDPTNSGHYTVASPVAACANCHADPSGNVTDHPFAIGTYTCIACHNPHSTVAGMTQGAPHYNNITSGMYPASYVTSRAACRDCHFDSPANLVIRQQWYTSGHARVTGAPWVANDFKTMAGCVPCHTTTGFIAYSTGKVTAAWGDGADKTKEVLACNGCHRDITTGAIRMVMPVRPFADDIYTNRDVGESNICMGCHSGTNNGQSIAARLNALPAADFANQEFVEPHFLAAAGTLHGKAGYQFAGRSYAFYSTNTHRTIGIGNRNETGIGGPCIACHKNPANGHTFVAGFQNGATPLCANCHGTSLDTAKLTASKSDFANALDVLKAQLAARGFACYSSTTPRFRNTNWGVGQAGADTMGAAFNYAMLRSEPGAYAHNSAYAKQLLLDSIDYLHNGTVTGSIDSALESLVGSNAINLAQSDSLKAYQKSSSCTSCHEPAATGSHASHLSGAIACSACHGTTAAANTALVPGTATHIDGMAEVAFAPDLNGNFDSAAKTCSALYCHSDGTSLATGQTPVGSISWGGAGLACTACHGNPPAYANGAPKANSHSRHSFSCNTCHAGTTADGTSIADKAFHANRAYNVTPAAGVSFSYAYAATGGTCSSISCHHNGTATWGGILACDGCHDAPPATASHLKHYGGTVAQAGYGDTRIAQDFGASGTTYVFGCGTCHPLDHAKHMNGVVEVELYNAAAPAGSLKKLNPASASYTAGATVLTDSRDYSYSNGTCSNIYCHSYETWTTPTGVPSYATTCTPSVPADLVTMTNYRTVTWGGPSLGCAGCHANPPRTSYPGNGGAAGDSHSWLSDDFGWGAAEFLHNNNMYFETGNASPISCMYCHNDTVRQLSAFTRVETIDTIYANMSSVPIYNFSKHVNGAKDVAFEKQLAVPTVSYVYGSTWAGQKLANATYDSATKTCSNVACHLLRTDVKWGTPYKGGVTNDCERCHNDFAGSCPDEASALNHLPTIWSTPPTLATPGYQYSYAVNASEPGGGVLTYALTTAPAGMSISPTGVITWTPSAEQMGSAAVSVLVNRGSLIATQDYTVSVQGPQPLITSTPVTSSTAWKAYSYKVVAAVPGGMPAVTYALTSYPAGMAINASTGNITWTPTDLQIGSFPVTVSATSAGSSVSQNFTLRVDPSPITFTSTPVTSAATQVAYSYPVTATIPGGATLSYSLPTKPAGMTINSATGVISWTPTSVQVGSYAVTVQVSGGGYFNRQSFAVVSTASPITITSTPVTTARVGVPYGYAVTATMPGGGTFTYALPVRPTTAMVINAAGVISWTPTVTYVGTRAVTVTVTRGSSSASQSFNIVVSP